jgi:hypothetical protein
VHLPYVEVVRLHAGQRFLEHAHGDIFFAPVSAHLGHHDRLIALALERCPHALLAHALVVLPGVVKEVDAVVEGLRDHGVDLFLSGYRAEVIAAQADDRHLQAGFPHGALWYLKIRSRGVAVLTLEIGNNGIGQPGLLAVCASISRLAGAGGGRLHHGGHRYHRGRSGEGRALKKSPARNIALRKRVFRVTRGLSFDSDKIAG